MTRSRRSLVQVFGLLAPLLLPACDPGSPRASPAPNPLPTYGTLQCDALAQIDVAGHYMVQNNIWNAAAQGQKQCITAHWDGMNAGFTLDPIAIDVGLDIPASYPSIVYGWQWGKTFGAYMDPRRLSDITRVPSSFAYAIPNTGRYDVAYDIWLHSEAHPADPTAGLEIMIWTSALGPTPLGTLQATTTLAGATWEVWFGPNGGYSTATYRRTTNAASVELDVADFLDDAVTRGFVASDAYLLGVQAGFEVWQSEEPLMVTAFEVSVE